jgi:hypothetical protein
LAENNAQESKIQAMDGLLLSQSTEKRNWFPIAAAFVFVAAIVAVILLIPGERQKRPNAPPAYAVNLKLTNVHMVVSENFIGSSVTYVEGSVANAGDKTVTSATVQVVFKNSLNEVVQTEDVPLQVVRPGTPYRDFAALNVTPLAPGKNQDFRLTFEHISADWNQQYPQLTIVDLTTK